MRTLSITYVSATLLWVATTSNFMRDAFAEDWPRFRGLNGTGISVSTGLPTKFGPGVALATVLGFSLSEIILPLAGQDSVLVVQALIIGAIVHSLVHRGHILRKL